MTGPRVAAPQIVVEAPESVGLVLASADNGVDQDLVYVLDMALRDAATAAAEYLAEHFTVTAVTMHDAAESDPDTLRPHAHIVISDTVNLRSFETHAAVAHTRYQSELKEALSDGKVGITTGYPSSCGWEITGAIPFIRKDPTPRRRCPEHGHALWALELVDPAERIRQVG